MPHQHPVVFTADVGALLTAFGSFFHFLPELFLLLPTFWYSILIYDRFRKK